MGQKPHIKFSEEFEELLLENGAEIAGHASTKTTQLYDRRDKLIQAEIERIRI